MHPLQLPSRLLVAGLAVATLSLHGAALLDETFEKLPLGPVAPGAYDAIVPWEGPQEREYGYISIVPAPAAATPAGLGKTIAIHDNTAQPDRSASLTFRWEPTAAPVSVAWDFLVANDQPFLGIHFLGTNWADSAAIVVLSGGSIQVQHAGGDSDRATIGTYTPGQWRSIRIDLDPATKTFDAYLDGKKVLVGYDWQRSAKEAPSTLGTVADYSTADHQGAAVLHLDNVKVGVSAADRSVATPAAAR